MGEAEAVPRKPCAAAPPVALKQTVMLGLLVEDLLTDTDCVAEGESEAETVKLLLEVKKLLAEELCEAESVAHWLAEKLAALLALRVTEVVAEAVPRKPSAAAPPVALMLEVPHPLTDTEGVVEVDCEPEPEKLPVGVTQLLEEELSDTERVGHWLTVELLAAELLRVPVVHADAVPR